MFVRFECIENVLIYYVNDIGDSIWHFVTAIRPSHLRPIIAVNTKSKIIWFKNKYKSYKPPHNWINNIASVHDFEYALYHHHCIAKWNNSWSFNFRRDKHINLSPRYILLLPRPQTNYVRINLTKYNQFRAYIAAVIARQTGTASSGSSLVLGPVRLA